MITDRLINSYLDSGTAAYANGEFQSAGKMFMAAYQKSKTFSKTDPRLAVVYYNLSLIYYQQKRFRKCESLLERALAILAHCGEYRTQLADNVRTQLANVYFCQQKLPALMSFYKNCLDHFKEIGGHGEVAQTYDRVIDLYIAQGKMRQAEIWCKQAIQHDKTHSKEDDPAAKKRLLRLASVYAEQGKTQNAVDLYQGTIARCNISATTAF